MFPYALLKITATQMCMILPGFSTFVALEGGHCCCFAVVFIGKQFVIMKEILSLTPILLLTKSNPLFLCQNNSVDINTHILGSNSIVYMHGHGVS